MYYLAYIRNQQEFFDSYHSGLTKFPTENKFSSFKPFGRFKDNPTSHCMSSIVAPVCLICDLMKSSGLEVCYETKRSKIWQILNSFPNEAIVWETPSNQKIQICDCARIWKKQLELQKKVHSIDDRARNLWDRHLGPFCLWNYAQGNLNVKGFSIWIIK